MSEIEKMVSDLEQFDDSEVYTLRNGHIAVSPFDDYPGENHISGQIHGQIVQSLSRWAEASPERRTRCV